MRILPFLKVLEGRGQLIHKESDTFTYFNLLIYLFIYLFILDFTLTITEFNGMQ